MQEGSSLCQSLTLHCRKAAELRFFRVRCPEKNKLILSLNSVSLKPLWLHLSVVAFIG